MKKFRFAAFVLLLCFLVLFVLSGFQKRTDVVLLDYTVQDEQTLLLHVALPTSMGYIRDITTKIDGNAIRASFFTAFGGLNSDIGARSTYEIQVPLNCNAIYFDRGSAEDALVLIKTTDRLWEFPKLMG